MRRGERTIAEMIVVGVIASALGIAAALAINWFPPSASKQAGPIDTLWDVLLIVSIPIFVLVVVVVLFSVINFRMRPGQENEDGPPIHGNTRLEIIWTAIPSLILVSLCTYAYLVLLDIEKSPADARSEMHVKVIGQQFTWHFEYPGAGAGGKAVKSDQLYLPVGRSVKFDVVSKDVLHDFWVPAFRMKIDAVPGITTNYRVTPTKLGAYPVVCAELCGLGHAFMRQTAHVMPAADFDSWLTKKGAPPAGAAAGAAAAGKPDAKNIFVNGNGTSIACGSCHTLADAGTSGAIGPDLDKVLAKAPAALIREDILMPDKQIAKGFPAHVMPQDFGKTLSAAELTSLVDYLHRVTAK